MVKQISLIVLCAVHGVVETICTFLLEFPMINSLLFARSFRLKNGPFNQHMPESLYQMQF